MFRYALISVALVTAGAAGVMPAQAQKSQKSDRELARGPKTEAACRERAVTMVDLTRCAEAAWRRQKTRLGAAVTAMRLSLREDGETRPGRRRARMFEASLKKWRRWRDAECAWRADLLKGGTAAPMMRLRCLADLTRRQVAAIRAEME